MCLSDGSGAMVGSIDARAKELADLHATDHFGAYLDFYFDKRFSPARPKTKFTRSYMFLGAPLRGFRNRDDGDSSASGNNDQTSMVVGHPLCWALGTRAQGLDQSAARCGIGIGPFSMQIPPTHDWRLV